MPAAGNDAPRTNTKHRILIHCRMGVSRSTTIAAAYLMFKKRKDPAEVLKMIRAKRNIVGPNPNFQEQLRLWHSLNFRLYPIDASNVFCEDYEKLRRTLQVRRFKNDSAKIAEKMDEAAWK